MFLNPTDFSFTQALEANWRIVLSELNALSMNSFMAFPERHLYTRQGETDERRMVGKGWDVFGLYAFGREMKRNCRLCPETARLVRAIPDMTTAGFSRMEPGTHIKPHEGYSSAVLRCHLGLITPDACALRVGSQVKGWEAGKCLVFDDTTEHEAWNRSGSVRVVLLIDFKKPGATFEVADFITSRIPEN